MVGLGYTKVLFIDSTSARRCKGPGSGPSRYRNECNPLAPSPYLGSSLLENNALLTTRFPNKFAMAITFGCCSKVSHYGSFGLNTNDLVFYMERWRKEKLQRLVCGEFLHFIVRFNKSSLLCGYH
jgi:hypothetical protein